MDKITEKLNKLSLPATILVASIILGGFYYASQVNKQKSIERQQQIEIEQKQQEQLDKELKEKQAKEEAEQALNACLRGADDSLKNSFIVLCKDDERISGGNETSCLMGTIDDTISYMTASNLYNSLFKRILDKREKDRAECFKKYPQK